MAPAASRAFLRGRLWWMVLLLLVVVIGWRWRMSADSSQGPVAATQSQPAAPNTGSRSPAASVRAAGLSSAVSPSNYPNAAAGIGAEGANMPAGPVPGHPPGAVSAPGLASTLQALDLKPSEPEERRRFRYWYPCAPGAQANSGEYEFWADGSSLISGAYSARIASLVSAPSPKGAGFCQMFRADEYRGKRVAFAGHLRTLNAMPGAQLVIRADSRDGRIVALAQMREGVVPGNLDWYRHTIVVDIPQDAHLIMVGAVLINAGSLWVDDVSLEAVDASWPLTASPRGPEGYSGTQPAQMVNLPPRLQDPGFETTYVKTDR